MIFEVIALFFAILFIFIPTGIAFYRNLKRRWACFWINLFFGWILLVWIPLIIWAALTNAVETKSPQ